MNHHLLPDWNIEGDVSAANQKNPMGLVVSIWVDSFLCRNYACFLQASVLVFGCR